TDRSASNFTRTFLSDCKATPLTLPTRTPATRTESPALRRDASLKTAEYPVTAPVRYWPKVKNKNAVRTAITTTKTPNLTSVGPSEPLIPVVQPGQGCAVGRQSARTTAV